MGGKVSHPDRNTAAAAPAAWCALLLNGWNVAAFTYARGGMQRTRSVARVKSNHQKYSLSPILLVCKQRGAVQEVR